MAAWAGILAVLLFCPCVAWSGPTDGPTAEAGPPALWGAVVHDGVNDEDVWFGGSGGPSRIGALGTWIFKNGPWRELTFEPTPACLAADRLQEKAGDLYAAVSNRYYRSETPEEAKADLAAGYTALATDAASGPARKLLESLAGRLAGPITVKQVAEAREAWMALVKQAWACRNSPPPRCKPSMAFDDRTGKIVLFGGEGVYGVYNDLWVYDCATRTWTNPEPKTGPGPRMNGGMIARDGQVYLVGGYQPRGSMDYEAPLWQRIPLDVWRYDIAANTWTRLSAGQDHPFASNWTTPIELTFSEDGTKLRWRSDDISMGQRKTGEVSGEFSLPGSDAGTAAAGAPPGQILVRGVGFDPAWYEQVPPADPAAVEARLKALPANKWVDMKPPCEHVQRDWGTTVLDPRRGQLLHWGGGHCTHFGTDVAHYSIAMNRWHILYTPELPFEHCYNSGTPAAPALVPRPWAPHTYLGYAPDSVTGLLLWTGGQKGCRLVNPSGSWLYDPATYRWQPGGFKTLGGWFDPNTVKTCMVPTPRGVAVWACKQAGYGGPSGLWLADVASRAYRPVAGTDRDDAGTYPASAFGDRHGIAYDSKRDRVLMFHFGLEDKYRIRATDLATGKVTVLTPKHSGAFPPDASMAREATYIPDADVVILCSRGTPAQHTLVYDCAADAWLRMIVAFDVDDKGRPSMAYGVSSGIEWDAQRKLLWHVSARGHVHAMRFDRATADLRPLGGDGRQDDTSGGGN